jgi:hypothetical protein
MVHIMDHMLKLVAFVYLLQLVPCVHAGDLINTGPVHGMGATVAWLTIAALTSRLGGADAQTHPPHPGGETFGNVAIYEACRVAARQACLDEHGSILCDDDSGSGSGYSYKYEFYELGCQYYNQGYHDDSAQTSYTCCDLAQCNAACVRCFALRGYRHAAAAACCCTHICSLRLLCFREWVRGRQTVRCVAQSGNCRAAAASLIVLKCAHNVISFAPFAFFASGNGSASTVGALRCTER